MASSVIEVAEEEVNFNRENSREIHVERNTITLGNTVYQISSISQVTVRKWRRVKKAVMPIPILLVWLFCGALIFTVSPEQTAKFGAALVTTTGWLVFLVSRIGRTSYLYQLRIEFNSGTVCGFEDENRDFFDRVASRLHNAIENPNRERNFTVNLRTQEIHNHNYDYSTYAEGSIIGNLINSGMMRDTNVFPSG